MNGSTMDFGAFPPEVNSARMYLGPGSGPMLGAAAAWDGLAAQLRSTAAAYTSAVSELEEVWTGPSSASMAAATFPYIAWTTRTAAQAEQAATQAAAAAGAYEAAFAMTVPPPVIAANRSLLATLVATNFLGLNTAAIAAAEAEYGEMWAQDAAAMYGYAASSAMASTLAPFVSPPQMANPGGPAAQGAAASQAGATSAASDIQSIIAAIPAALEGLAAPLAATDIKALEDFVDAAAFVALNGIQGSVGAMTSFRAIEGAAFELSGGTAMAATALPKALPLPAGAAMGAGAVSAGMGRATFVGSLSAPQSWAEAAPAARAIGIMAPGDGLGTVAESAASGAPGVPGMPMPGAGQGSRFPAPRYGLRLTVMPRPVAVG